MSRRIVLGRVPLTCEPRTCAILFSRAIPGVKHAWSNVDLGKTDPHTWSLAGHDSESGVGNVLISSGSQ